MDATQLVLGTSRRSRWARAVRGGIGGEVIAAGGEIDDGYFERAEEMEVAAQTVQVASLGDVLATKLLAITEQDLDLGSVLEIARSLREQIDWDFVRERTDDSPFARAFFTLVEELGIVEPGGPPGVGGPPDAQLTSRR